MLIQLGGLTTVRFVPWHYTLVPSELVPFVLLFNGFCSLERGGGEGILFANLQLDCRCFGVHGLAARQVPW